MTGFFIISYLFTHLVRRMTVLWGEDDRNFVSGVGVTGLGCKMTEVGCKVTVCVGGCKVTG
jgi:hypothetical protein